MTADRTDEELDRMAEQWLIEKGFRERQNGRTIETEVHWSNA